MAELRVFLALIMVLRNLDGGGVSVEEEEEEEETDLQGVFLFLDLVFLLLPPLLVLLPSPPPLFLLLLRVRLEVKENSLLRDLDGDVVNVEEEERASLLLGVFLVFNLALLLLSILPLLLSSTPSFKPK